MSTNDDEFWFKDCVTGKDKTEDGIDALEDFEAYQDRLDDIELDPETDLSMRDALA